MEMSGSINDKQVDQNQNNMTAQTRLSWKPITLQRLYERTLFQSETCHCFHCNTDGPFHVSFLQKDANQSFLVFDKQNWSQIPFRLTLAVNHREIVNAQIDGSYDWWYYHHNIHL